MGKQVIERFEICITLKYKRELLKTMYRPAIWYQKNYLECKEEVLENYFGNVNYQKRHFYQAWWMCKKARWFGVQMHALSERILNINIQLKPELFLETVKQLEEKSWNFAFIYDNHSKIIVCTEIERFGNTCKEGMIGEDDRTCWDGQIDLFV